MANDAIPTRFEPDPERMAVIAECQEHYDVGDPGAEWPNNMISRRAVVDATGAFARRGETSRRSVDADELATCRRLAGEALAAVGKLPVGMGSESGDTFQPFFIAAARDTPAPSAIDEALIRQRFAGTIFPPATIAVEPLAESETWWTEVMEYGGGDEDEGNEDSAVDLARWRAMIRWFVECPDLVATAFVQVGDQNALWEVPEADYPHGTENTPCVLPRLALGLTHAGSLVGLFGVTVQT